MSNPSTNEANWIGGEVDRTPTPHPPPVRPGAPPPRRAPPPAHARPAPQATAAPRGSLRLSSATAGLVKEPLSLLIYGVEGVGKTSFAAAAPKPLMIGAEKGSAEIGNVQRLAPESFEDVLGLLHELRTEQHDFRTVVLDSLDWLERMVWKATCARGDNKGPKQTIEGFGFGKGYTEALAEWGLLVAALDGVRDRGVHVILIAHAHIKPWKNPVGDDFDRYTLKLNDKASGLWKEWAKAVCFANFERSTENDSNDRAKGFDTGRRILYTRGGAAYDAKNRLWLPAELLLGWSHFARAMRAGQALMERWYAALDKATDEQAESAREYVEAHNYDPVVIETVIAGLTEAK